MMVLPWILHRLGNRQLQFVASNSTANESDLQRTIGEHVVNELRNRSNGPGITNGAKPRANNSETLGAEIEPRTLTTRRLQEKLARQRYRCYFTGLALEPHNATLEYLVPLSRGGAIAIGNVAFVRSEIAHMKGRMLPEEFVEWCGRIVQHHDDRTRERAAQEA